MSNVLTNFLEGMSHRGVAVKSQINRLRIQLKGTDNEGAKETLQNQIDQLTTQLGQVKSTQTEEQERCAWCSMHHVDPTFYPYCCQSCATQADVDNEMDESVITEELQPWDVYTKETEKLWYARSKEASDAEATALGGDYGNEMEADMVNREMEDDPDPAVRRRAKAARAELAQRLKKAEAAREAVMKKWEPKLKAAWIAANPDAYAWLKKHGHLKEDYTGAPEYKSGQSPMTVPTEDSKVFGFAFKKQKKVKEGEATQSSGSLYGGPTGSIGESELSLQGFTSFREGDVDMGRQMAAGDAPIKEAWPFKKIDAKNAKSWKAISKLPHAGGKQPQNVRIHPVKEGVAPVYEVFDGYGQRMLTHVPPRPLAEDTYAVSTVSKISEENKWKCPICKNWTNDVMGKSCAACKVKMDRVQYSTEPLKEAIGNAPTRNGFFKNLVQKFPGLPARYRNVRDNFAAESQDKPTLHKISVFANESGLQTSINKSGYGDWDSTWVLTVSGFRG